MLISSPVHFISTYVILPHSLVFSSSMFPLSQLSFSRHLPHLLTCPPSPVLLSLFICSSFRPANIFPVFPSSMPSALSASSYPLCSPASSFSLPSGVNGRGICRLLSFLVKRLRSTEQHQHNYYQSDFIRIHQLRAFLSRSDHSIHFIAELACLCSF